jgi:CRP-like cAMP-binding protein
MGGSGMAWSAERFLPGDIEPNILAKTRLADFTEAEFDFLTKVGFTRQIGSGQVLITEGEPSGYIYIVLAGGLLVSRNNQAITPVGQGCLLGELEFLSALPPSATVTAQEDSVVFGISGAEISKHTATNRDFAIKMFMLMGGFAAARVREHIGDTSGELNNPSAETVSNFQSAIKRLEQAKPN